jgi:hypothetical protein
MGVTNADKINPIKVLTTSTRLECLIAVNKSKDNNRGLTRYSIVIVMHICILFAEYILASYF